MVEVETVQGRLRGRREGAVCVWCGIPYAAPPVGALRFRAPRPPLAWAGVREADRFGASAPQPPSHAEAVLGLGAHLPSSEDCLTLNVWSAGVGGTLRPVMVWVHGGSFLTGAGSDAVYDGSTLAGSGEVVVVTLNYRLGPLGFLHLRGQGAAADGADENCGLQDIVAALRWVRDNIAAFGGDPSRVTVFGQSAGAMAIGAMLGMPAAHGLFGRAVLQSGAAAHVHDRAGADRAARRVLSALGLARADLRTLRALPVERLVAAAAAVAGDAGLRGLPFQPVVDGATLPRPPLDAVAAGAAAGVPLLIGTTRDELSLYEVMAAEVDGAGRIGARLKGLSGLARLAAFVGLRRGVRALRAYPRSRAGALDLAADLVFGAPAVALAEAQAGHGPVYLYRFDWRSPAHGGRLRACHALEVPFVWCMAGSAACLLAPPGPGVDALSASIRARWIAFARTGIPADGRSDWPRYGDPRRPVMILGAGPDHVVDDPEPVRRRLWSAERGGTATQTMPAPD